LTSIEAVDYHLLVKDSRKNQLREIGWREWVSLPELKILEIKTKIDTGARSSALHAFDIRTVRKGKRRIVRFKVYPYQRDASRVVSAEAELLGERRVRSSSGKEEVRPVIRTPIMLGERQWTIELTLTNRVQMGFRMLLGREAIKNRFLINPGKSYRAGRADGAKSMPGKKEK